MRARTTLDPYRRDSLSALLAVAALAAMPADATVFSIGATDVIISNPAPLFTSAAISGRLTLDSSIAPGESFGAGSILDLHLNFAGIIGTLADINADVSGPLQGFGTRSADGMGFSVIDLRFGFQPGVPGCSFVCAGQIILNSPIGPNDPSNFIAIDDFDVNSLSIVESFTPTFAVVPEPHSWALMIGGFGLVGLQLRRRTPLKTVRVQLA